MYYIQLLSYLEQTIIAEFCIAELRTDNQLQESLKKHFYQMVYHISLTFDYWLTFPTGTEIKFLFSDTAKTIDEVFDYAISCLHGKS